MAIRNLNLVLNTLDATNVVATGIDAGAKVLGLRMPEALSQGRPMSPGFERFEAYPIVTAAVVTTVRRLAKRNATAASNLPGKSVRSRDWALPITWATTTGSGRSARAGGVSGRAGAERHVCHHQTSGHDYPSHDRRDDQHDAELLGSALSTNRGK